jgi:hypothetical protein
MMVQGRKVETKLHMMKNLILEDTQDEAIEILEINKAKLKREANLAKGGTTYNYGEK